MSNELSVDQKSKIEDFLKKFPTPSQKDIDILNSGEYELIIFSITKLSTLEGSELLAKTFQIQQVYLPSGFFRGYFHSDYECLSWLRLGNPHDPSYGLTYDFPDMEELNLSEAISSGAVPCPNCCEEFLEEIYNKAI